MLVYFNGKEETVSENCTIKELLDHKNIKNRVSIWVNGKQILLKDYATRELRPNDQIKLIRILGGG